MQHAEPHHHLKTVADADDETPTRNELEDSIVHLPANLVGEDKAGTEMVGKGEPTDECEDVVVEQFALVVPIQNITVQAEARRYEDSNFRMSIRHLQGPA